MLKNFTNFANNIQTRSSYYRPDNEACLQSYLLKQNYLDRGLLARAQGLSYGDSCVNHQGSLIDMARFNHFLDFDLERGCLICEANISFAELFKLHSAFIPAVIPGTLHASLGGGIANDVHGKNNSCAGNFGHHIEWLDLQVRQTVFRCSEKEYPDLFYATIGGLGLTGIITRLCLRLKKQSAWVKAQTTGFEDLDSLLKGMIAAKNKNEYAVAWLNLLQDNFYSLLSTANPLSQEEENALPQKNQLTGLRPYFNWPKLPLRFVSPLVMKYFNPYYFKQKNNREEILALPSFNNPLDVLGNWNYLYGKKGLLQFQALFPIETAQEVIKALALEIAKAKAYPILAVLKLFSEKGRGLLSFSEPGFTLAIDFINEPKAKEALKQMNALITEAKGKIYLAKDLFLTERQFQQQYPEHEAFRLCLEKYRSPMASNLSYRLGLTQ